MLGSTNTVQYITISLTVYWVKLIIISLVAKSSKKKHENITFVRKSQINFCFCFVYMSQFTS